MLQNEIISMIATWHPEVVRDSARRMSFAHGDVIGAFGNPIDSIVFPRTGLISVVVNLKEGDQVEAAMVGQRGLTGGPAILGGHTHLNTSFAQIAGDGWSIPVEVLKQLAAGDARVAHCIYRNEQFLLAQAQQVAACNAKHHIPNRLCTWLLRASDYANVAELVITQEYMAQMLGVQRASVSMVANPLQARGLINYRRGRIQIVDRAAMQAEACECYHSLREQEARVFQDGAHVH